MNSKFFFFVVVSLSCLTARAQSLEQVLSNHYNAMGEEILVSIRSVEMELVERSVMGNERLYKIAKKRPNKIREEIVAMDSMTYIAVYDGVEGYVYESWKEDSVREMTIKEQALLEIESAIGSPLRLADLDGHQLSLLGVENIGSKRYSVLRMTFYESYFIDFYVEQSSQLLYKYIAYEDQEENVDYEYFYKDFKRLGGFVLPYSFEKRKKGEETVYYSVQDLVFGSGASDDLYALGNDEESAE
ncbi:hypothetical protein [Reichenbachiella ulvae]|uniref:Outer membrane lipoprotein-sorting protein n=1 Tax=Reichenbachiella ulvae TaxID=2980104 RepID=A0ABT3CYL9_9BACT|nr:hypothetical protein [Reichenbachiella ulvae]MCV9388717.1 hypothetical protein [Reichenbachiella ulvae]